MNVDFLSQVRAAGYRNVLDSYAEMNSPRVRFHRGREDTQRKIARFNGEVVKDDRKMGRCTFE